LATSFLEKIAINSLIKERTRIIEHINAPKLVEINAIVLYHHLLFGTMAIFVALNAHTTNMIDPNKKSLEICPCLPAICPSCKRHSRGIGHDRSIANTMATILK